MLQKMLVPLLTRQNISEYYVCTAERFSRPCMKQLQQKKNIYVNRVFCFSLLTKMQIFFSYDVCIYIIYTNKLIYNDFEFSFWFVLLKLLGHFRFEYCQNVHDLLNSIVGVCTTPVHRLCYCACLWIMYAYLSWL